MSICIYEKLSSTYYPYASIYLQLILLNPPLQSLNNNNNVVPTITKTTLITLLIISLTLPIMH